ncbi:hypothetical protein [Aeromonas phage T7-Ah]|uniref:Uncharacterized protein n=1 Tax=Aeromonas phage T7-Ah TaxID=2759196 RepID=A0A7S6HSC4_9CAUD|nr:hypothetical protein [Aeromonas phage T7-Ah]
MVLSNPIVLTLACVGIGVVIGVALCSIMQYKLFKPKM